jgi:hypothetical protein
LNTKGLIHQIDACYVARSTGCERDFPRPTVSRDCRYECRFAAGGSFDRTKNTAFHTCVKFNVTGHRNHRAGFGVDRLLRLEFNDR